MTHPPNPDRVQPFLKEVHYPVSKAELVHIAEEQDVDTEVLRAVRLVPDRTYETQEEVRDEVAFGS
ncbi:DUF2795 domain-containing protein [Saccharopolyspora rhizosphaerae]|uniref:DUF2795 domain-containing protein n=1 Tax=Saccharopolyspora rhizosphaerae TaxID=2492662 RepID=A0A426JLU4_9PSEU|nr:DUF2795 domain-containing protein [Saccharopolyspora rhizosphaerae]RRO14178.1 DUF2795 domain-containing protein [Saccharopolyspora rhizosphaerae]